MEAVLANLSISISEFRKNPAKVLREAGRQPIAVLNHNKPAFYLVEPRLFEALVEHLEDIELADLAAKRMAKGERSIRLSLDEI
jgi:antitoxin StbD